MGNEAYFYRNMADSPAGREIVRLEGDGGAISRRGSDIESLGDRMQRAANTLRLIADEQVGKGDSLDQIKDQAADVHADLKKAGELYLPSGTALKAYGDRLAEIQPQLNQAVADAETAWETVRSRAGAVDDAADVPEDEGGGTTARDDAKDTAEGGLASAESEWRTHALAFDRHYDSWEAAYDRARDALEGANEDGVEDDFWDNALPFIEGLVTVLEWVGVALVIAALIIGGPILGVIAAVLAVIVLIGTVVLAAKGRKDGKDIAFAALGVIPFGKLGKLAKLGDLASTGAKFPKLSGLRNLFLGADDLRSVRTIFASVDQEAGRLWNATTQGRNWNQLTMGSRFIQRVIVGAPRAWNGISWGPRTMDMAVARFAGYGDTLAGIGNGQRVLSFVQGLSQTYQLADFANGKVGAAQQSNRVESWR